MWASSLPSRRIRASGRPFSASRNISTAALDAMGKARRSVEALNLFHTMQNHMSSYPVSLPITPSQQH
ncbi:hypothetical protein MLD38_039253 [Melastoma candidum]|uniref:Uncharacterized protein n=1 Tax=Melastoma candidum TaxID=119954 RepID=A0ACB9L277_9MYRT|nr:hypothetical protein MLD38_039253 [Melastoma candidum]